MALLGGHASGAAAAAAFGPAARPWLEALTRDGVAVGDGRRLCLQRGALQLRMPAPHAEGDAEFPSLLIQDTAAAGAGAPGAWRRVTVAAMPSKLTDCTDLLLVSIAQEGGLAAEHDVPIACLRIEDAPVACFAAVAAVVGTVRFAAHAVAAGECGPPPSAQGRIPPPARSLREDEAAGRRRLWLPIAGRAILGLILHRARCSASEGPALARFLQAFLSKDLRIDFTAVDRPGACHRRLAGQRCESSSGRPLRWTNPGRGLQGARAHCDHALRTSVRLLFETTGIDCKVVCGLSAR